MRALTAPVPAWLLAVLLVAGSAATLGVGWAIRGDDDAPRAASAQPRATAAPSSTPYTNWRNAEYAKIRQLAGGLSLAYFNDVLGAAIFITPALDGSPYVQHLWRGRDYWVQAIADEAGTVQFFAVTSCDKGFTPAFDGVPGALPNLGHVVLQQTRMAEVGTEPGRIDYSQSAATANSYFFDEYYLGNPGNYKTYFAGINDACGYEFIDETLPFVGGASRDREFDPSDAAVRDFRARAVINTYAETAVFFDEAALEAFQIGPDRILTRTAPPHPDDDASPTAVPGG